MKQLSENDSKRIAQAWAEQYGTSLLAEVEAMRQQEVSYQTPHADRAVRYVSSRRDGRAKRRRTTVFTTLAAAACLIIVAWLVGIPSFITPPFTTPPSSMGPDGGSSDALTDSSPSVPDAGMMPISFDLPADYRVVATDYDNGMSLYALESVSRGGVVLTMYHANEGQADAETEDAAGADADAEDAAGADADAEGSDSFATMSEVVIDGTTVPAKIDEAYMLLAFERAGVRYTLSSRDDMGALAAFYRSIARMRS